jgi:hypothetical protein
MEEEGDSKPLLPGAQGQGTSEVSDPKPLRIMMCRRLAGYRLVISDLSVSSATCRVLTIGLVHNQPNSKN